MIIADTTSEKIPLVKFPMLIHWNPSKNLSSNFQPKAYKTAQEIQPDITDQTQTGPARFFLFTSRPLSKPINPAVFCEAVRFQLQQRFAASTSSAAANTKSVCVADDLQCRCCP